MAGRPQYDIHARWRYETVATQPRDSRKEMFRISRRRIKKTAVDENSRALIHFWAAAQAFRFRKIFFIIAIGYDGPLVIRYFWKAMVVHRMRSGCREDSLSTMPDCWDFDPSIYSTN